MEKNMKCPHCTKDINFSWANKQIELSKNSASPIFYQTLECHHCHQIIFFLFKGLTYFFHEEIKSSISSYARRAVLGPQSVTEKSHVKELKKINEIPTDLIFQYPFQKTVFNITGISIKIKESLNEAERCFSVGARNGTTACLRKCIYAICDDRKVEGADYSKKIEKLFPLKNEFSELAKQIKWLGDNHMHNVNEEKYTKEHIEKAIEVMPLIIREIYGNDEKIKEVKNLLNQGFQKTKDESSK